MDENKTYSIVGTVTIGTDEYRDLIEGKLSAEKDADKYRSDYWERRSKVNELEKQIEELKAENEKLKKIVNTTTEGVCSEEFEQFLKRMILGEYDGII